MFPPAPGNTLSRVQKCHIFGSGAFVKNEGALITKNALKRESDHQLEVFNSLNTLLRLMFKIRPRKRVKGKVKIFYATIMGLVRETAANFAPRRNGLRWSFRLSQP